MSGDDRIEYGDERPNVVLITTHDLGRHVGCYGIGTVDTPNVDSLADRGVQFENAYATAPVCSPSRGSLLTGRYPQSNGLMGLTHDPFWWSLDDGETVLPELLGEAGYDTHLLGFQHVADDPARLGFDRVHSTNCDAEETTEAAAAFFESVDDDRPFYAQLGFTEVHRSFDRGTYEEDGVYVPPYLEPTETVREDFARFQASINYFDDRVGEVLGALDAAGLRDETVVVLTADHGIPHPGAKWTCRRPGIEIALLLDGPGPAFERRESVEAVTSNVDVLPTLLDVLDVSIPNRVEGVSFRDYLEGVTEDPPRDAAFAQYTEEVKRDNESRCVVTDEAHLIRYFDQGRAIDYPVAVDPVRFADHVERMSPGSWRARPFAQLYDTTSDPHELDDRGSDPDYQNEVGVLSARLLRWMVAVDDPLLRGRVRLPYYERAVDDLLTTSSRNE